MTILGSEVGPDSEVRPPEGGRSGGSGEPWVTPGGLYRRRQGRVVAGVAGGLADRLGVGDVYVRAAFATLATMWGLGILIYVVIWRLTLDTEGDRPPKSSTPDSGWGWF